MKNDLEILIEDITETLKHTTTQNILLRESLKYLKAMDKMADELAYLYPMPKEQLLKDYLDNE